MFRWLVLLVSFGTCLNVSASNNLTSLNDNGIRNWEHEVFSGESTYSLLQYKSRIALKATSDNSASGLVLRKQIDLFKTPYINWTWLAEKKLPLLDEHSKAGDDYVARVYVVINGGLMVWNTKSLSYVWSSNQSKGQVWDNAFAGSNVKMISVRGKNAQIGQWYNEKRNVYQDLIDYFGDKGSEKANLKAYRYIDMIAIMTDTDNSGSRAESYYGDIVFSNE
jgi:hypothetical protein